MKRKNIFKTLAFWRVLITALCVVVVIGFSCALIFYTKIFQRWDRVKVFAIDDYNGYTAKVTYIVDEREYKNELRGLNRTIGEWLHVAVVGDIELYVDYLVSDPNCFLPYNTRRDAIIVLSVLWSVSVGISTIVLIKIYKKIKR